MNLRQISLVSLIGTLPCLAVDVADVRTIEHGLRESPGILVNSQGLAQHDLSMRGSSFSGAGISINGLNLKSPWSAHFNSELPMPAYLLSAPAMQYGLENISGHLIGTVSYQTQPMIARQQAGATLGTKEHYGANVLSGTENVGGFLDWEKARKIDYDANDLTRIMSGAHLQTFSNEWRIDLIGGYQHKEFGVQGYYLPEEQVEDALVYAGATKGDLDGSFIRAGTVLRQMDFNTADSRYGAVMLEGRTIEIQHVALNLRGDVENEYARGRDRTRGSVLILPEIRLMRYHFKAGLNAVFQTSESAEFLPQAGIDWFVNDNSRLYAAYVENIQQPDYHTLDNNPLLQQQKTRNTELGFRQFLSTSLDWRMAGFYRKLENASDWLGGTATDLGDLNVTGLDSAIHWYPSAELQLQAYYQWIHKDSDLSGGLYETDYPEHLLMASGQWHFLPEFLLFASQTLRYQTENALRTSNDFGAEASLGLHYNPRFAKNTRLTFRVDNLWGSNFQAIPGLKPRPLSFSSGITVTW